MCIFTLYLEAIFNIKNLFCQKKKKKPTTAKQSMFTKMYHQNTVTLGTSLHLSVLTHLSCKSFLLEEDVPLSSLGAPSSFRMCVWFAMTLQI